MKPFYSFLTSCWCFSLALAQAQNTQIKWVTPDESYYSAKLYQTEKEWLKIRVDFLTSTAWKPGGTIRLLRNGKPYSLSGRKMDEIILLPEGVKTHSLVENVMLIDGENRWEVELRFPNQKSVWSKPLRIDRTAEKPLAISKNKPNLYVFCVGVGGNGLLFPQRDAQSVYDSLKRQAGGYYEKVDGHLLVCKEETELSVLKAKMRAFSREFDFQPQDLIYVFLSSHGQVLSLSNSGEKELGLRTSNQGAAEYAHIGFKRDIVDVLKDIQCTKVICIDACFSGAAGGTHTDNAQKNRIIDETPQEIITLASSTRDEESFEDSSWGNHGAFTHIFLEGLTGGRADTNSDGLISVQEIAYYLQFIVPTLTRNSKFKTAQTPRLVNKLPAGQDPVLFDYRHRDPHWKPSQKPCVIVEPDGPTRRILVTGNVSSIYLRPVQKQLSELYPDYEFGLADRPEADLIRKASGNFQQGRKGSIPPNYKKVLGADYTVWIEIGEFKITQQQGYVTAKAPMKLYIVDITTGKVQEEHLKSIDGPDSDLEEAKVANVERTVAFIRPEQLAFRSLNKESAKESKK